MPSCFFPGGKTRYPSNATTVGRIYLPPTETLRTWIDSFPLYKNVVRDKSGETKLKEENRWSNHQRKRTGFDFDISLKSTSTRYIGALDCGTLQREAVPMQTTSVEKKWAISRNPRPIVRRSERQGQMDRRRRAAVRMRARSHRNHAPSMRT